MFFKSLPLHLVYVLGSFIYFARAGRTGPFLRAKARVIAGLPSLMAKRRAIQRQRTASPANIDGLLEKRWLQSKAGKYRDKNYAQG